MSILVEIEEKPDYLVARFTGAGNMREVTRQFPSIAERCRERNKSKVLLSIEGARMKLSMVDRYQAGDSAVVFALNNIRVAAVGTPEQLDPQRFAEVVARNRGVDGRVFSDVAAAEEWLLKEDPA